MLKAPKAALLSVTDKTGLENLARKLSAAGTKLYASSGTQKYLAEFGIPTLSADTLSRAPEAFQGRMKTLSHAIFSGILFRRGDAADERQLTELNYEPIDCVIVNFYNFRSSLCKSEPEILDSIDVGGPSLVRAAAKNWKYVWVFTDHSQYENFKMDLTDEQAKEERFRLAQQAFRILRQDNEQIEQWFYNQKPEIQLKYGENPTQKATFIPRNPDVLMDHRLGARAALSYNNLLDGSSALDCLQAMKSVTPGCSHAVIVKHQNPCGVSSVPGIRPENLSLALQLAWYGDSTSAFGGVVALSGSLNLEIVSFLEAKFIEVLLLPASSESEGSKDLLKSFLEKKKGLKVVFYNPDFLSPNTSRIETALGTLIQGWEPHASEELQIVAGESWTAADLALAQFGVQACRFLKSNAIAVVSHHASGGFSLVGAGQGQPNRIDALELLAIPRALKNGAKLEECILVSDGFFPFSDSIQIAHKAGIQKIVQPGGSIRDADVVQEAKTLGIKMAFTGKRHFKHTI